MKTWVKACFLGTIVFITLFTVSLIIGFFIMTKSGQFVSGHHQPVNGQYHNPDAEKMINRMEKIRDEFDVNIVHDLDNHDDRLFLRNNGLMVKAGQTAHFKAIENPSTGFTWHIDHESCAGKFEITATYTPGEQQEGETPSGLGGNMLGASGSKEFHLKALDNEGECVFRIASARQAEW